MADEERSPYRIARDNYRQACADAYAARKAGRPDADELELHAMALDVESQIIGTRRILDAVAAVEHRPRPRARSFWQTLKEWFR